MSESHRVRSRLLFWMILLVALGLGSRRPGMPDFVVLYVGDVLWGAFFYVLGAFAWPRATALRLWAGTIVVTELIEASQAWQAPWFLRLRATTVGGLLLGHQFLWSDVLCVAVGASAALLVDLRPTSAVRAIRQHAAAPVPVFVWVWLATNVLAASVVLFGFAALGPPPELKPGDVYYGGPGDGLVMMFFVSFPFLFCWLGNLGGFLYTAHSLVRKRGFWTAVASLTVVTLWICVLGYLQHAETGVVRLGG